MATLQGTDVDNSLITGLDVPEGLATHGGDIYWGNSGGTTIGRADLNGTDVNNSFITGASTPLGITFAP